jgi:ABC-2 type transport system ATP-binding protein
VVVTEPLGIEVRGLTRRFGQLVALDGLDLSLARSEIVALLGENGAGKSTLIRVLATTMHPNAGEVLVEGYDVLRQPTEAKACIGLVLAEERSFFWRLTGRANLEFFAALRGMRRRKAARETTRVLAEVDLSDVADRRVDRYSTGMRARLSLARALLGRPSVLLLDEPTRSLDAVAASEMRMLIATLARDSGAAVLLATHNLHEAAQLATRTVIISHGRIVASVEGGTDSAALEEVLLKASAR